MNIQAFQKAKSDFQSVLLSSSGSSAPVEIAGHEGDANMLRGLRQIVYHRWFRRIWTIQEVSLAKKVTLQYGSSTLCWSALNTALTFENMFMEKRIPTPVLADGGYNPEVPIYNTSLSMIRMQQIQAIRERLRIARLDGHGSKTNTLRHRFRGSYLNVLLSSTGFC